MPLSGTKMAMNAFIPMYACSNICHMSNIITNLGCLPLNSYN